jgi:hypothetical protein
MWAMLEGGNPVFHRMGAVVQLLAYAFVEYLEALYLQ